MWQWLFMVGCMETLQLSTLEDPGSSLGSHPLKIIMMGSGLGRPFPSFTVRLSLPSGWAAGGRAGLAPPHSILPESSVASSVDKKGDGPVPTTGCTEVTD